MPTDSTFIPHRFEELTVNLGEIEMNYVCEGAADQPALLLIPGQTESWWGYEDAIERLKTAFQVFAVDLRGQGRSTQTPGRYSLNLMGNDLVRFIATVIKRPTLVAGNSSGGLLAAWLSAYAMPGQIRAVLCEDAPFFASETEPMFGPGIRQCAGPVFSLIQRYIGDQWSIGNVDGLKDAQKADRHPLNQLLSHAEGVPQNLKEYDPEWGKAFSEGKVALNCPHETLLSQVKTPVLYTHHMRLEHAESGTLLGAATDLQVSKVRELVESSGQPFQLVDAPDAMHAMHQADPARYASIISDWANALKC